MKGFGVVDPTMVAFMNQPGSAPPAPERIRKSFLRYWFSLKTPLRDGRSATHPHEAHAVASAPVATKARRIRLFIFFCLRWRLGSQYPSRDLGDFRVEDLDADDASVSRALVDVDNYARAE